MSSVLLSREDTSLRYLLATQSPSRTSFPGFGTKHEWVVVRSWILLNYFVITLTEQRIEAPDAGIEIVVASTLFCIVSNHWMTRTACLGVNSTPPCHLSCVISKW